MTAMSSEELIKSLWALGDELRKAIEKNAAKTDSQLQEIRKEIEVLRREQQQLNSIRKIISELTNTENNDIDTNNVEIRGLENISRKRV